MAKRRGNARTQPPYEGGGMGASAKPGARDIPNQGKSGRRVIGGVFPGEGMGLPVRGPTAPGSAARPNLNAAGSVRAAARSPTPMSILNSGRSYYGPLSYSTANSENRPYATGGLGKGNRNRPRKGGGSGNSNIPKGWK